MSENNSKQNNSIGFTGLLFLIFLTLKLAEVGPVQYWSWWWIFAPLWIPAAAVVILIIIANMFK